MTVSPMSRVIAAGQVRLDGFGLWSRYPSNSSISFHLPYLGFMPHNLPHGRIMAIGGRVDPGYFTLCQTLARRGSDVSAKAYGCWDESSPGVVPDSVINYNERHYGSFSTISHLPDEPGEQLLLVQNWKPDILFIELDGYPHGGELLSAIWPGIKNSATVLIVNCPPSPVLKRQLEDKWLSRWGESSGLVLPGDTWLYVGRADGGDLPVVSMLSSEPDGDESLMAALRVMGYRNERLAGIHKGPETDSGMRMGGSLASALSPCALTGLFEKERELVVGTLTRAIESSQAHFRGANQGTTEMPPAVEDPREGVDAPVSQRELEEAVKAERGKRFLETESLVRIAEAVREEAASASESALAYRRRLRNFRNEARTAREALKREHLAERRKLEEAIMVLNEEVETLRGQRDDSERQLRRMRMSKSWRYTAWLRRAQTS